MAFKKGEGGRPKGVRNKSTGEVREAARLLVEDPTYRKELAARVKDGKAPHMETLLWHYAYGQPAKTVQHTGPEGGPVQIHHHFAAGA